MSDARTKCIPFVNSQADAALAKKLYKDCDIVRLGLHSYDSVVSTLPAKCQRWIDAGVDGLGQTSFARRDFVTRFVHGERLTDPAFQETPDKTLAQQFVDVVLDSCQGKDPSWISVPQLPYVDDVKRNRINRLLADASGVWRRQRRISARLVLPIVLTHKRQTISKTVRNAKVRVAADCYQRSTADGYWVVDSSLSDGEGSPSTSERLDNLLRLQEELASKIDGRVCLRAVGPYWGLGLVMWARGLTDYLGVSLGTAYRYHLPGGHGKQPLARVSLPHLYRVAIATTDLKDWLARAAESMPLDSVRADFSAFSQQLDLYYHSDTARRQIATTHRRWYDAIAKVSPAGRQLALYQSLSSAYVVGKKLQPLPDKEKVRRPESVAGLLMLRCL